MYTPVRKKMKWRFMQITDRMNTRIFQREYDENSQIYAVLYNREIVFDPTPAQEIYSSFLHDTY